MARITFNDLKTEAACLDGTYEISAANDGYALHRKIPGRRGIEDVFNSGHIPAKDLYNRICAFRIGMDSVEKNK
ncbi:MAG: hypothetical protein LUQ26_05355 [Methylococcaceae bacterium]|nr:hypothetical protein [Methylococcaceae bacterium]